MERLIEIVGISFSIIVSLLLDFHMCQIVAYYFKQLRCLQDEIAMKEENDFFKETSSQPQDD